MAEKALKNRITFTVIGTCGWCKFYAPYKHHRKYVKGLWIGDGKCANPNSEFKVTVQGNACEFFEGTRRDY